jgi:hypothetical protein
MTQQDRRKPGDRRKSPLRTGDRREQKTVVEVDRRTGKERRRRDRRSGRDRRKAK